jgi:hypothetical protein
MNILNQALKRYKEISRWDGPTIRALATEYAKLDKMIGSELKELSKEIETLRVAGQPIPVSLIHRQQRYQQLMVQIDERTEALTEFVQGKTAKLISATSKFTMDNIKKFIDMAAKEVGLEGAFWMHLDEKAITAFSLYRSQIYFKKINAGMAERVKDKLLYGLATGKNPMVIGGLIKQEIGKSLAYSTMVARTEMLRAEREATRYSYAESKVVKKWAWKAMPTACPVCQAMNGMEFPIDEPMNDHPNGMCQMVPVSLTWDEIAEKPTGITEVYKPASPDENFSKLSEEKQKAILGPYYEFWKGSGGKLKLQDMVAMQDTKWGMQPKLKPLAEVKQLAEIRR